MLQVIKITASTSRPGILIFSGLSYIYLSAHLFIYYTYIFFRHTAFRLFLNRCTVKLIYYRGKSLKKTLTNMQQISSLTFPLVLFKHTHACTYTHTHTHTYACLYTHTHVNIGLIKQLLIYTGLHVLDTK